MPQLGTSFFNWLSPVQMKVVQQEPVDFEASAEVLAVPVVEMVIQPMPPRKVDRKPEGIRDWKWYEGWTTSRVEVDAVLQDPDGLQFRVETLYDWSQGGFFHLDLVEQPPGVTPP